MAEVTVTEFAEVLKVPVERLLVQLDEAGIKVSGAGDKISEDAKLELLTHLRRTHGRKDPSAAAPRRITLKRKSQSELRLAGGQGRARTINVEVRSKRTYIKRDVLEEQARKQQEELDAQRRAEDAKREEVERVQRERLEAEERAKEEARRAEEERESAARREAEEEETRKRQAEEDAAARQREEQAKRAAEEKSQKEREAKQRAAEQERLRQAQAAKRGKTGPDHTLHVADGMAGRRRKKRPARRRSVHVSVDSQHGFERPTAPVVREVEIPTTITVAELAQRMAIKSSELIKALMRMGMMVTINQALDQDTATLLVEEMGHTAKPLKETALEDELLESVGEAEGDAVTRSPVVTVMGHVDHGKTSLLDYIRRTRVASGEAGGITQHVGAYHVETPKGQVTFLDTPGHAAFTAMRARGAQVTDIVVLVVAADDGVMPQTIEAIQHARAAGVPLVVAINKIDREDADPDRVRNELSQQDVLPEAWGGDTLFVSVSAHTGQGIEELLDAILLQAELLDLKAVPTGPAAGVVIEGSLERGRGAVATVLVNKGTLQVGDILLAGQEYGRIRAMFDETGEPIKTAGPSTPVVVLGLSGTPSAGDDVLVVPDERKAREVAEFRQGRERDVKLAQQQSAKLDDIFTQMRETGSVSVNLVIKADVHGSAEALKDALQKISGEGVKVTVIGSGVGGITESDVQLAATSSAIVIGFNVRADAGARNAIKDTGVDVRYYSVIYEAIDDIKAAVSGLMAPEVREQIVGLAEVREVFRSPKLGNIAGCMVVDGYVRRSNPIRVLRDNVVIFEGQLESLRRFKDDVTEVRAGTECGIGVKNYNDVKVGDQIECYERTEVARTIQ
ncbi:MAG: translation initiation factor IF-2 [Gammaproteobacteria bacterium]|nr:translation initiation factor IF-2 [Gammaproteobacteria bacterium]